MPIIKPRVYLLWGPNPGFPIKTRGFPAKPGETSCDAAQAANIPTSLEFPGIVTLFLVVLSFVTRKKRSELMQTPNPWFTRDNLWFCYRNPGFGPGNPGFGKTQCFSKPVTKPWWTRDLPVITREIKRGLNASSQHLVLVGFCCVDWNQSGLWLLVFRNKASRLDGSPKIYWSELPNPWFCLKTLGFLRISPVLLVRVYNLYIYIYVCVCLYVCYCRHI